ncbi:MAG: hypothetical protein Q7R31_03070 [Candidatus Levybacteria bacterium]|nr:hypothetical protein [Candidatus Levybacteria bacterium]
MKRFKLLITFLVLVIVFLSIVQVVVSNRLSTTGPLFSKIEEETNFYKRENLLLSERLLTSSSLNNIALKAEALGFIEGKTKFIVTASLPLALRQ